jgi:hypothetical protein
MTVWVFAGIFLLLHCKWLVQFFVETPMKQLYFKGPRIQGYGFWNGLPLNDICAQITHTASEVWTLNVAQCIIITDRYFEAFYIGSYSVLYIFMLYNLLVSFQQMSMLHYQYRLFCQLQQTQTTPRNLKNK